MSTNLKCAYVLGSGPLQDVATSAAVEDTRIRNVHLVGNGTFTIEAIDELSQVSRIRVEVSGSYTQELTSNGVRMSGVVKVSAPTSASRSTIFYG